MMEETGIGPAWGARGGFQETRQVEQEACFLFSGSVPMILERPLGSFASKNASRNAVKGNCCFLLKRAGKSCA